MLGIVLLSMEKIYHIYLDLDADWIGICIGLDSGFGYMYGYFIIYTMPAAFSLNGRMAGQKDLIYLYAYGMDVHIVMIAAFGMFCKGYQLHVTCTVYRRILQVDAQT